VINLRYKIIILLCLQLGDLLYEKRQYGKAKWACIKMKEKQYEQSICLGFMKLMRYICEQNSSGNRYHNSTLKLKRYIYALAPPNRGDAFSGFFPNTPPCLHGHFSAAQPFQQSLDRGAAPSAYVQQRRSAGSAHCLQRHSDHSACLAIDTG